jgi:hypothetical protein
MYKIGVWVGKGCEVRGTWAPGWVMGGGVLAWSLCWPVASVTCKGPELRVRALMHEYAALTLSEYVYGAALKGADHESPEPVCWAFFSPYT